MVHVTKAVLSVQGAIKARAVFIDQTQRLSKTEIILNHVIRQNLFVQGQKNNRLGFLLIIGLRVKIKIY